MASQQIYKTPVHVVVFKSGATRGLIHDLLVLLNFNISSHKRIDEISGAEQHL